MADFYRALCQALAPLVKVRVLHRVSGIVHFALLGVTVWGAVIAFGACPPDVCAACIVAAVASGVRLLWMLGSAVSQAAVASTMLAEQLEPNSVSSSVVAASVRQKRRMWYVRWLWWGRFGAFVTLLQLLGATYLTFAFVKNSSASINDCYSVAPGNWHRGFFLGMALAAWLLTIMQCCIGPDILAWRSLYAQHGDAWRAHYHEIFSYGIREALCCLGRAHYITREEDEVDSVAAVLGDLVSYRAAGASHLEFFAGLALLQLERPSDPSSSGFPAPPSLIREATILHRFAVAAYTGPLLDIGRNLFTFLCVWLHRQGVLTFWNRHRRPQLEGDNWWRGHAAAFLRHLKLPPEALRQGRVHQAKRECAYFVTVVHELRSVVVAVRGTETPEDLLTDGLGRESMLTDSDLIGLLQSEKFPEAIKQQIISSKPHFAHEGIIEAARELAFQLDELHADAQWSSLNTLAETTAFSKKNHGMLTTLLGPGGECESYALRFVGHSLGGSIAALTALKLLGRYPELHVYGYGVLPCVDASIADACSSFVTSIVYNDEFSARLSVSSIKRLRIAAVKALAAKSSSDSSTITRLARRFLGSQPSVSALSDDSLNFTKDVIVTRMPNNSRATRFKFSLRGGFFLCSHAFHCMVDMSRYSSSKHPSFQLSGGLSQSRLQLAHLPNILPCEQGTSVDVLCSPECILDHGKLVSVSSLHAADGNGVSDRESVSLDAGRDGDNDGEESEVLTRSDDIERQRRFSAWDMKAEEDGKHHDPSCGEVDHMCEDFGKVKVLCSSSNGGTSCTVFEGDVCEEESHCEMFMPGLIIHLVPSSKSTSSHSWDLWGHRMQPDRQHRALIKDRRGFQDLVISASMFLDHMPWRCQYALNHVIENEKFGGQAVDDLSESLV